MAGGDSKPGTLSPPCSGHAGLSSVVSVVQLCSQSLAEMLRQLQPVSHNLPCPGLCISHIRCNRFIFAHFHCEARAGRRAVFKCICCYLSKLSFQRAAQGSVGKQSTPERCEDVTGIFCWAADSRHREQGSACGVLPPPTLFRCPQEIPERCPGLPGSPARPWTGSGTTDPCPGGKLGRVGETQDIQASLRQFQSEVLSQSRSGSDS